MKCPNCDHTSDKPLLECSSCGEIYEAEQLESFQHLEHLVRWLDSQKEEGLLGVNVHARLTKQAEGELEKVRNTLLQPEEIVPARSIKELALELSLSSAVLGLLQDWVADGIVDQYSGANVNIYLEYRISAMHAELSGKSIDIDPASDLEIIDYALDSIEAWLSEGGLESERKLRAHLIEERKHILEPIPYTQPQRDTTDPALEVTETVAPIGRIVEKAATISPQPQPDPLPEREPFDWGELWNKVASAFVSGAVMKGVLYLGAFMIVVSAAILVGRFWNSFPQLVQLAFLFSVPAIFYLVGWIIRDRLKLPEAGGVLTGIGAMLLAMDFVGIFLYGDQPFSPRLYWFLSASITTGIYLITITRLPTRFFGYVTAISAAGTLFAFTAWVQLNPEWWLASISLSSLGMLILASKMKLSAEKWQHPAAALSQLPQILLPISIALVIFVPGNALYGQFATYLLASISYAFLAVKLSPSRVFVNAAAWISILAWYFLLTALGVSSDWIGPIATLMAIIYLEIRHLVRRFDLVDDLRKHLREALNIIGFGLLGLAVASGALILPTQYWIAVFTFTFVSLTMAWWSYLFKNAWLTLLASSLFIIPYSLAITRWLSNGDVDQAGAWLMVSWGGLSLLYAGFGVLINKSEQSAAYIYMVTQALSAIAFVGTLAIMGFSLDNVVPILVSYGSLLLVYMALAVIHHSGKFTPLLQSLEWLPESMRVAAFLWPIGLLSALWIGTAVNWVLTDLEPTWLGTTMAALSLGYVVIGHRLGKLKSEYQLPLHVYAYLLGWVGILLSIGHTWALVASLYLVVAALAGLSYIYWRVAETILTAVLVLWPFYLSLQLAALTAHTYSFSYALLAALVYIPVGLRLDRAGRKFALPLYMVGYIVAAYAVFASLLGRIGYFSQDVLWVGASVPLIIAGLLLFGAYKFRSRPYAWLSVLTFSIFFGQSLTWLAVDPAFQSAAWSILAFVILGIERWIAILASHKQTAWLENFHLPLGMAVISFAVISLAMTAPNTVLALARIESIDIFPLLLAQSLVVLLVIVAAWAYRSRWPIFLEPWLAFIPVTLFFAANSSGLGAEQLSSGEMGLVWVGLGAVHFVAGALLDKVSVRYAHGLFLGGYALIVFAALWTLREPTYLVWTLGVGILASIGSALLVHFKRHRTWDELARSILPQSKPLYQRYFNSIFLWIAAWVFPVWSLVLLLEFNVSDGMQWMGFGGSGLLFLGIAVWLRRYGRAYAWPFITASQFYIALGLLISLLITSIGLVDGFNNSQLQAAKAFILFQAVAVIYYGAAARVLRTTFFAHVSSWLSFFPLTLAGIVFAETIIGQALTLSQFALLWIGWAVFALLIGWGLDNLKIRYTRGPYLFGYLLSIFALVWSAQYRLTNVIVLGVLILIWIGSQVLVHFSRHRTYIEFVNAMVNDHKSNLYRVLKSGFLNLAVVGFPFWLSQLLLLNRVSNSWLGVAFSLTAPIYIALGLILRRAKKEYSWPLYVVGYILTAVGVMMTFEDQLLTIYALALNVVVYAISAYIFRQAHWLYISSTIIPIVALLTIDYNLDSLPAQWVSGTFIGIAFIYFGIAQLFDRYSSSQKREVSGYAAPFYFPAYLLSAIAIAVASAGGQINLAIVIYLLGIVFYALSAWVFQESVFLYPAAWLAAVPYYLLLTQTALETRWYGIAWLPLIIAYIGIGRFFFHTKAMGMKSIKTFITNLDQPAMPFYLMAYGLSLSMLVISQNDPIPLTLSLFAAAMLYIGSSVMFKLPIWLYPGLLAAHLGILSYFAIDPSGNPKYYIALPFLAVTWLVSLIGFALSRRIAARQSHVSRPGMIRILRWEIDTTNAPFLDHFFESSWARPLYVAAVVDLIIWQSVAFLGFETAITFSVGAAILLGLFAFLWQEQVMGYASLGFLLLATVTRFAWAELAYSSSLAWIAGIGLGMYLYGLILKQYRIEITPKSSVLEVWNTPLKNLSLILTGASVIAALPIMLSDLSSTAIILGFSGAQYLAVAYRGQYYRLGYLGMAMLQIAWAILLFTQNVSEPQYYAIPAGAYFIGIGYLERKRTHPWFGLIVEGFGLSVLLLTTFIQSINIETGFPYFVLLLIEGLLVAWWAAVQRLRNPFFIGLGAVALNVGAQVLLSISVYDQYRFMIILGIGLLLVTIAVFIERQREQIILQTRKWRNIVEDWD